MDILKLKATILPFVRHRPIESTLISLSIITIFLSLFLLTSNASSPNTPITIVNAKTTLKNKAKELYIDVSGAVKDPGIYVVEEGARIYEVIEKAGGISESADVLYLQRSINQSKKLRDEEKIFIPFAIPSTSIIDAYNIQSEPSKIPINSASTTLLESLPGVGKVTAENIVNHRPFSSIEEMVEKKVVTTRVFEQIKDLIDL